MKRAPRNSIAVAACTFALDAQRPTEVQLAPAGQFRARDGRPGERLSWQLNSALAAQVIAAAAERKTPLVIDYEHQTLYAEANGQAAPAAGWFRALEWRDGQGLFATDVEWTDRAAAMIAAKEYRFLSPVLRYDRATGAVLAIEMAALTNTPAIDGLAEIELRAAAKFSHTDPEDTTMNPFLLALLKLLDLDETATEAQATAALSALKAQVATKDTEIAALKTARPDPAQYVPVAVVEELKQDLAALKNAEQGRAVDELVQTALADGRLLPAMETWARDLGQSNLATLKTYVESAQPIAALTGTQTGGKPPAGGGEGALNDTDLAVCKQLGISADDYKKANAQAA